MIILNKQQFQEILGHAESCLPAEACGLLGGTIAGDLKTIKKVYLLANLDNSAEHFSMDPKEQFVVIKEIRNNGWVLLGNFHSHPETPARPSEEDKKFAFDPTMLYFIISLANREKPVLKAFQIKESVASEETIKIVEG